MICKICGKEIKNKFYLHLNSSHKTRKDVYLASYPEQVKEYAEQRSPSWCKGLTKENNPILARAGQKIKEFRSDPEVRKQQSLRMKERYKNGDIMSPESRKAVVLKGSLGWQKKVASLDFEQRRLLLSNFTTAGNKAQEELRKHRTPEDYERLYPWAKGHAASHNCDCCGKAMIIWLGGKPRPKKRFCNGKCLDEYRQKIAESRTISCKCDCCGKEIIGQKDRKRNFCNVVCINAYRRLHPNYMWCNTGTRYYSSKMQTEFFLHSKLEIWFATLLDASNKVGGWSTLPFHIEYYYEKMRKYYADFLVDGKIIFELKSNYVFGLDRERNIAKLKAAERYCDLHNMEFLYWQFNGYVNFDKFKNDERVKLFFGG